MKNFVSPVFKCILFQKIFYQKTIFLAYEYIQDSEITGPTLQSGSEEDLLDEKV